MRESKIKNIIFCFVILCVGLCFAAMSEDSEVKYYIELKKMEFL
jgi:hypothetical protein